MSLFVRLQNEFKNHKKFWNYYDGDFKNPLESLERSNEFVDNFFMKGSKEHAVFGLQSDNNDVQFRNIHSVNVFFIGVLLQRQIDVGLSINSTQDVCNDFAYIWFLAALAHDMGYIFELQKMGIDKGRYCDGKRGRLALYQQITPQIKKRVCNFPLSKGRCYCPGYNSKNQKGQFPCERICEKRACQGTLTFSNGIEIKQSWYGFKLKEAYFKYIFCERGHMDHGIAGADKFYYNMIDNYQNAYKDNNNIRSFTRFEDSNGNIFACEQFKIFNYIADCIACHNIFKADESVREKYQEYGLDKLLSENFKKISYEKNPLLFVLCLADAVEPSKRFYSGSGKVENEDILSKVDIDYNHESKTITVEIGDDLADKKARENYIKNLKAMEEWIDINVSVCMVEKTND